MRSSFADERSHALLAEDLLGTAAGRPSRALPCRDRPAPVRVRAREHVHHREAQPGQHAHPPRRHEDLRDDGHGGARHAARLPDRRGRPAALRPAAQRRDERAGGGRAQARRAEPRRHLPRHHADDAAPQRLRRHQPGDRLHLAARATSSRRRSPSRIEDVAVTPVEPSQGAEPRQADARASPRRRPPSPPPAARRSCARSRATRTPRPSRASGTARRSSASSTASSGRAPRPDAQLAHCRRAPHTSSAERPAAQTLLARPRRHFAALGEDNSARDLPAPGRRANALPGRRARFRWR